MLLKARPAYLQRLVDACPLSDPHLDALDGFCTGRVTSCRLKLSNPGLLYAKINVDDQENHGLPARRPPG